MTATQVKARMLALLDEVSGGDEIVITRHGRPIARLVPARGPHTLRGRFAGVAMTAADNDALLTTGVRWEVDT
jgi:prevent-host-death family protein